MTSPLELLKPEYAHVKQLEEQERKDRVANSQQLKAIANKQALLIKNAKFPTFKFSCNKGTCKYIARIEECERERRLASPEEVKYAKANALKVSKWISQSSPSVVLYCSHKGTIRYLRSLEDKERQRRLEDKEEEAFRIKNAKIVADSIRTQGPTISARLLKRSAPLTSVAWEKSKEALSVGWSVAQSALHIAEQATSMATSAVKSYIPSTETIKYTATHAKEALVHQVEHIAHPEQPREDVINLSFDTRIWEESERTRRLNNNNKDEEKWRKENARIWTESFKAEVPSIMVLLSTPRTHEVSKISTWQKKGKKMAAAGWRTANSAVDTARQTVDTYVEKAKSTASSLASFIPSSIKNTLSHAFSSSSEVEPPVLNMGHIKEMEEKERKRRIDDQKLSGIQKANAKRVARIIKHQKYPVLPLQKKGTSRYVKSMEERERRRRMANKDEAHVRQMNARKVSNMLSDLGWPFIRLPKSSRVFSSVSALEEEERRRRIREDPQNFTAITNARKISTLIKNASLPSNRDFMRNYTRRLEEKERRRRMYNPGQSMQNAHKLANIFATSSKSKIERATPVTPRGLKSQKVSFVEYAENEERKRRLQDTEEQRRARKKARKLSSAIRIHNAELEDKQRLTVLRDKQMRRLAQELADSIAEIMSQDTDLLEDTERKARINDKVGELQARSNANRVSGMVLAHFKNLETDQQFRTIMSRPTYITKIETTTTTTTTTPITTSVVETVESVRKMMEKELASAQKEKEKADTLRTKGGFFKNFRLQMHDNSAKRHLENAQKCSKWLETNVSRSGLSASE